MLLTGQKVFRVLLIHLLCLCLYPDKQAAGILYSQDVIDVIDRNKGYDWLVIADGLFKHEKYFEAIPYYEEAYKSLEEKRTYISFRLGDCYRMVRNYQQAYTYYRYCLGKKVENQSRLYLHLSEVLLSLGLYEEALERLESVQDHQLDSFPELLNNKRLFILSCKFALKNQTPKTGLAVQQETSFPSKYSTLGLFIRNDSAWVSTMTHFKEKSRIQLDSLLGEYPESYQSALYLYKKKKDGGWKKQERFMASPQTSFLPGCMVSKNSLFFTAECKKKTCAISYTSFPKKDLKTLHFKDKMNIISFKDPTVFFFNEKQFMIFSALEKESLTGYDLFLAQIEADGILTQVHKLNALNSSKDEISPYFDVNQSLLYFSSNGLPGFGNYDVFYARGNPLVGWKEANNMLTPVNSAADEYYYFPVNQELAYVSSNRNEKNYQLNTLYTIEHQPNQDYWKQACRVMDSLTGKGVQAEVSIDRQDILYLTNKSGILLIETYQYPLNLTINASGFMTGRISINNPEKDTLIIKLRKIERGMTIRLYTVYFQINQANLLASSSEELDRLASFLRLNRNVKVEISGHTDNTGVEAGNVPLSENRAIAVKEYLVKKGIHPESIVTAGYSSDFPLAENDTEEGRRLNRRVECNILSIGE